MTAADLPQYWWRVEVDARGDIVSCEQVDEEKQGSKRVRYIWGTSKAAIVAQAKEWHARHRRYQSESCKRLADKRRAASQCVYCGKPLAEGSKSMCAAHIAKHREANRRHRTGESVPRKPADPVQLREQHYAHHRRYARLAEQLPELLAKYDELDGTPSPFRRWLEQEIAARETGPALRLVRSG